MRYERMSVEAAQGYIELGLFQEAWEAIEELDTDERMTPLAIHIRLHCAIHFEKWDMTETLAALLTHGDEEDRLVAANTFKMLAVIACRLGDTQRARSCVTTAIEAYPDIRIEIIEDELLSEHLL